MRTSIEVADIFRAEGAGYRAVQAGHLSLTQLKVMSAMSGDFGQPAAGDIRHPSTSRLVPTELAK